MKAGEVMSQWQTEMKNLITTAEEIKEKLNLSADETERLSQVLERYPMSITPYYLSLADKTDPNDPILKMCVPDYSEMTQIGSYDTSGEADNTVSEGLQHKYRQTALVLTTNRCAMYCRHCFRRRLVGLTDDEIADGFGAEVEYIQAHPEITNVILSGGDALMLSNDLLRAYLSRLTALPQLDLIRIATRMPVVLPMRIYEDGELLEMLREFGGRKRLYVVTQFNHPREITPQSKKAVEALTKLGVVVKNQTVLLRGVNDDPSVLGTLLRELTAIGVVPYYIFQCRPVKGVKQQFQVPLIRGVKIVEDAKNMQNGQGKCVKYCMSHPRGKIEIVGQAPDGQMIFKFHQAKYREDDSRIFLLNLSGDHCWLTQELTGE
jgi:KamA family protein